MYATTAAFLNRINETHDRLFVADLYFSGVCIAQNLRVSDWSISVDRNAANHRTASITLAEPGLIPPLSPTLSPMGIELKLRYGVVHHDGTIEYIPLGVFPVHTTAWDEALSGALPQLTLFDRSKTVERVRGLNPSDRSGLPVRTVLTSLVLDALPSGIVSDVVYGSGLGNPNLPSGTTFDYERWSLIQTCGEALGADIYFDVNGICQVKAVPAITPLTKGSDAVWTIAVGTNMMSAPRSVSKEGVYNAVSVFGVVPTDQSPQPRGGAVDQDPNSETYFYGPFGQSVLRVNNPLLMDVGSCNASAAAILANSTGISRSLTLTALPNPALETGDLILAIFTDGSKELHLVDSFTLNSKGSFNVSTRSVQYQPKINS